jgi:hypothetical protein
LFKLLGASTGIQLISQKIAFVEGIYDKEVMQTFYEEYSDRVSFIVSYGVRQIDELTHTIGKLLNEASKYESFLMLRDRDFLDDKERLRLHIKYNNRVHIWSKRCIENFLLDHECLLIIFKGLGITTISLESQISSIIKQIAHDLKNETLRDLLDYRINKLTRTVRIRIPHEIMEDEDAIVKYIMTCKNEFLKKLSEEEIHKIMQDCRTQLERLQVEELLDISDGKRIL